jgi:hypothetical protein
LFESIRTTSSANRDFERFRNRDVGRWVQPLR